MRRRLALALVFLYSIVYGQQPATHIQPATVGIYFTFDDFATAAAIRATSLGTVLREKKYGKLQDMFQGLAVSYGKGISEHYDFVTTLTMSSLPYPIPNLPPTDNQDLLFEWDASVKAKMFGDNHWFVPYLQAGAGLSKYEGYYGTFIPVGVGLQIGFFGEAYLHISSQYRIAVSENTSYHFVHSIGIVGNIGSRL